MKLGVTSSESATLDFFIRHVGQQPGTKLVNQSITYSDKEGNVVSFPKPTVSVECDVVVRPETCPEPVDLTVEGMEHQRGMKAMTIPAHSSPMCRDVLVKCIKFVVPEDLCASGETMCRPRKFKARFLADNIDTDYRLRNMETCAVWAV